MVHPYLLRCGSDLLILSRQPYLLLQPCRLLFSDTYYVKLCKNNIKIILFLSVETLITYHTQNYMIVSSESVKRLERLKGLNQMTTTQSWKEQVSILCSRCTCNFISPLLVRCAITCAHLPLLVSCAMTCVHVPLACWLCYYLCTCPHICHPSTCSIRVLSHIRVLSCMYA